MTSRLDLLAGEAIVFSTSKHWIAPLRSSLIPLLLLAGAFVVRAITPSGEGFVAFVANVMDLARIGLVVAGIGWIAYNIVVWRTATFAVTDRRVLREEGLASRRTSATMLSSVTDVQTRVSFMGKRLGYGDLVIFGKGGERAADRFLAISRPLEFRDQVMTASTEASTAGPMTAAAGADPVGGHLDTLARLAELRDAGALTVDEFEAKKAEILARI